MVFLTGDKVILRDLIKEDIENRIRWETLEVEWQDWDAPWENTLDDFEEKAFRERMLNKLESRKDGNSFRYSFEICLNDNSKKHIGWINAYNIDNDYTYTKKEANLTIGINIPETSERRKGYATEAWTLYIKYIIDKGVKDIYTQTWSGNYRVIGLMKKLGFEECNRIKDKREVRGERYDGLTFKLNLNKFNEGLKGLI